MSDLIDRQAAIDAIEKTKTARSEDNELYVGKINAQMAIMQLPSAEPQIIRCKDCKHRDPEDKKCDCGHDIRWQLPRRDDWYCADAERNSEQTLSEADNDTAYGGLMSAT